MIAIFSAYIGSKESKTGSFDFKFLEDIGNYLLKKAYWLGFVGMPIVMVAFYYGLLPYWFLVMYGIMSMTLVPMRFKKNEES